MTFVLQSTQTNGVTYADPTDPDLTVRFKFTNSPKTLSGVSTTNYVTEIIINDSNGVTIGSETVNDAISVRLKISGAYESISRTKQLINSLVSSLQGWVVDEHVLVGFAPQTVPATPADFA
jgi:hypothetical protein